jgi:hypothetical protein
MVSRMTKSGGKQNSYGRQKVQSPSTPNAVWSRGRLEGFRCYDCGKVDQAMWGDKCKECQNCEDSLQAVNDVIKGFTGSSNYENIYVD